MKKKLRNDLILILAVLILAGTAFAVFKVTLEKGKTVSVQVDGKTTQQYKLSDDVETVITTGDDKGQRNVLRIKDGTATVTDANCPDKICKNHKPISNEGEAIVCLPHKVVIIIE